MPDERAPMTETPEAQSANVYALLAARARQAPDGRLALDAAVGAVALAAAPLVPAIWWAFLLPFVTIGAYGIWGIADRELGTARGSPSSPAIRWRMLTAGKWVAAAIGTGAALASGVLLMGLLLGRIIS